MRLLLFYPVVAGRSCEDCQTWLYDDVQADGSVVWKSKPMERHGKPVRRPNVEGLKSTPCHLCPKGSPEKAKNAELNDANIQAVRFYKQVRATGGRCLTKRMLRDEVLLRNLATIDEMHKHEERLSASIGAAAGLGACGK